MHCTPLGIAVAKQVFQLHGVDERSQVVVQKRVSRGKLRETTTQFPPDSVAKLIVTVCYIPLVVFFR